MAGSVTINPRESWVAVAGRPAPLGLLGLLGFVEVDGEMGSCLGPWAHDANTLAVSTPAIMLAAVLGIRRRRPIDQRAARETTGSNAHDLHDLICRAPRQSMREWPPWRPFDRTITILTQIVFRMTDYLMRKVNDLTCNSRYIIMCDVEPPQPRALVSI